MTDKGTDYLSLVREEFVARGVKRGKQVSFVKVKNLQSENARNKAGTFLKTGPVFFPTLK